MSPAYIDLAYALGVACLLAIPLLGILWLIERPTRRRPVAKGKSIKLNSWL